jgi:hypothetical protein
MSFPLQLAQSVGSPGYSSNLTSLPSPKHSPSNENQYIFNINEYVPKELLRFGLIGRSSVGAEVEFRAAILDDPTLLALMVMNMPTVIADPSDSARPTHDLAEPNITEFEGAAVTLEALQFCGLNSLVGHLTEGIKMARKHFSSMADIEARLECDPEDADQYVVLKVNSSRSPESDLESYLRYCDEWSDAIPWPASRLIVLDFSSSDIGSVI